MWGSAATIWRRGWRRFSSIGATAGSARGPRRGSEGGGPSAPGRSRDNSVNNGSIQDGELAGFKPMLFLPPRDPADKARLDRFIEAFANVNTAYVQLLQARFWPLFVLSLALLFF